MPNHIPRLDVVTFDDLVAERKDDIGLGLRVRVDVAVVVDDLDPDRMLVEANQLAPGAFTRVVSRQVLGDHPDDPGLGFVRDDVMDADLMLRVLALEDLQGGGSGACSMMEDQAGNGMLARLSAQRAWTLFDHQPRELRLRVRRLHVRLGRRGAADKTCGNHHPKQPETTI
jgi:hypothetical protein